MRHSLRSSEVIKALGSGACVCTHALSSSWNNHLNGRVKEQMWLLRWGANTSRGEARPIPQPALPGPKPSKPKTH